MMTVNANFFCQVPAVGSPPPSPATFLSDALARKVLAAIDGVPSGGGGSIQSVSPREEMVRFVLVHFFVFLLFFRQS